MVNKHNRVILTIREHIGAEEAVGVGGGEGVGIDEPAVGKVVVPALEVVETRFAVVVVAAVTQGIDVPNEAGGGVLLSVFIVHGVVAPCAVVVGSNERTGGIQQRNDVALRVEDIVVERRGRAVVVDHGERLVAVVIDKLERLIAPLLPHDLAGERGVVVRRAVDRFAGTDTGHVISIGDLLPVDRCGGKLAALRPREGIILAVVIRDRVAGGRDAARLGLAFVENVLRRAADCHAREQVGPRGVRVAKGLYDRAVGRDAADVAHRVVGAAAQRDAADNDDDLWLCADGCTHHSDHLSISLRAVQQHRPL